jgi:hypothetical protein
MESVRGEKMSFYDYNKPFEPYTLGSTVAILMYREDIGKLL